jgi:excisionase family DNA binding protein
MGGGNRKIEPELLRTAEACQLLGVGRSTLYRLARAGKLRRKKLPGSNIVRWARRDLVRFSELEMRYVKGPARAAG